MSTVPPGISYACCSFDNYQAGSGKLAGIPDQATGFSQEFYDTILYRVFQSVFVSIACLTFN